MLRRTATAYVTSVSKATMAKCLYDAPIIERRLTVAGKLLLHRRLSLPGSTLPSTDQLTSPNATYSALQVLLREYFRL